MDLKVHPTPVGELIATEVPTAAKPAPFQATAVNRLELPDENMDHVAPDGDVPTFPLALSVTIRNLEPSHGMTWGLPFQVLLAITPNVQIIPSGECRTLSVLTATKTDPFQPNLLKIPLPIARSVQVVPSGEVAALLSNPTSQKTDPFHTTATQPPT
jgi:hypothetical protein